jgi:putative heme-binding domain-containing protein
MLGTVFTCVVATFGLTATVDDDKHLAEMLEQRLMAEPAARLAKEAREHGDATRGALLFYRQELMCARCHDGNAHAQEHPLGPDLARPSERATGAFLVESILNPNKVIKKGFETVTIATRDGKVVSGLLDQELQDAVVLRDTAGEGKLIRVPKAEIEERANNGPSSMPAGLVNLLVSRQEFLDVARYVIELTEKGPARAKELRPNAVALNPAPLPEYENDLDHAGLITALDQESYRRGEAIYERVCANCHGTREGVGSLPTSPRFATGTLRNGGDPYRMYQTLTRGFGQMPAQTWMVPRQKYDVIHYIREAYFKTSNPAHYTKLDRPYLQSLPQGTTRGPEPAAIDEWAAMDRGPSLNLTVEAGAGAGESGKYLAYKGIATRLDEGPGGISRGGAWMVQDHDTMNVIAAWTGQGFIDWNGINFNGKHEVHPRIAGQVEFANATGPGWADPATGSFDDPRTPARDGRRYGPLPRSWLHYRGLYHFGERVIVSYDVGSTAVLEMHGMERNPERPGEANFSRTLEIAPRAHQLVMRVAPEGTALALVGSGARLVERDGARLMVVPPLASTVRVKVLISRGEARALREWAKQSAAPMALTPLTKGGRAHWPEVLVTKAARGEDAGAFAVDVLTPPERNPWLALLRFSGLDFLGDGNRAVLCTWDGDVWVVDGLRDESGVLSWRRIASGLFQPLGVKVRDGQIYVACRDQIVTLRDLNGDGETDFYENFNSDHQVTEHFHEFAMDLQTDDAGNFYYAKAARHGKTAVVPQHGTLLRVSADGGQTEILATGFRAPNGVCLNRDGTFFLTDQEGFWTPKNRINWVKKGGFYGNMWGYTDVTDSSDSAMEPPVCWITNAVDRSPAELLWVESRRWGPLEGALLNLSYGYGKIFVVARERIGDRMQGGISALPIPAFPTGVMRGRFHPGDAQLYVCGLYGWAGNQTYPGGFYRVRAMGKAVHVPLGLKTLNEGVALTFSAGLDRASAVDLSHYEVKTWSLKRSVNYGSEHIDEKPARVVGAGLSEDGKTVILEIEGFRPVQCIEIKYALRGVGGERVEGQFDGTIHAIPERD